MPLQALTDIELRDHAMLFIARLRGFQTQTDHARAEVLDKTLPGWSDEARASGFRRTTRSLQSQHEQTQEDFHSDFSSEAASIQRELLARLGIPVRHDGEKLEALRYDAADYLEELVRKLVP
ncbi:MAG TPA: hypothetical protein VHQ02_07605 [Usitatibacter sp.]|jgi:hypothetical protein|nr:hypothetical protein [Usitatibacter sp.]